MNKIYKIDSKFYFISLLVYKEILCKELYTKDKIIEICKNKKESLGLFEKDYIENYLNINRTNYLLNCVGSAVFIKNSIRYFGKINDILNLFLFLNNFYFGKINCFEILEKNLIKYNHQEQIKEFSQFFNSSNNINQTLLFDSYKLKKEIKNLIWFIKHNKKHYTKEVKKCALV